MARFAIVNAATVENVVVATAAPVVAGRTVVGPLGPAQAVGPGDSWNGAVFTQRVPTAQEAARAAAPSALQAAYPTLRQWALDAQATRDAAVAGSRNLTTAENLEFLRRMGILMNHLANLLAASDLDS